MLEPKDLTPADNEILDLLNEGRVTAPYARDETDYALSTVRSRLNRFVEHEVAEKIHEGLYELKQDPREQS